jgi:peptide/nickel transport system permease protein
MSSTARQDKIERSPSRADTSPGKGLSENPRFATLHRLLRNRKGFFGVSVLVLLVFVAIFGPYISPHNPNEIHATDQLAPPSRHSWFGADELGRDIFSRIIAGTRVAVIAGLLAVALAASVGTLSGIMAGYLGGITDSVTMRVWDALLAFPAIFLAIGIVTILGPGWVNAVLAIAVINMPVFARVVRAATLATKGKDYVEAARSIGCSSRQIMITHLLPNTIMPAIILMAIAVPEAILVEASLSFLGLGSQPPDASWGNMLSSAQGYLSRSSTYAIFPGVAITIAVVGMNFFADGLQDALDPRRNRTGRADR